MDPARIELSASQPVQRSVGVSQPDSHVCARVSACVRVPTRPWPATDRFTLC
jgi:hypothetical protein